MKEKKSGSKNFLVQGTILAAASIIAKIIGLVYRIPLNNILGDAGISYYSTANEIYSIMLMISSFSLPLAVSKLVSERLHRGEYRNAYRVFLCAVRFAVLAGGIAALFTYVFAGIITKYVMSFELAVHALRVLAPGIFICAIVGVFRGFFQGYSTMMPTAVSQVIEQIVNAVVSVVCAGIMFNYGMTLVNEGGDTLLAPAWGAAGGTFGTVASLTVAMFFMMFVYSAQKKNLNRQLRRDHSNHRESEYQIYRTLILTVLPIVLSTVVYNISNVADQGIFNKVLNGQGYTEEQYATIWGIYTGKFRVLMNVPLSLASCLAPSIVPSLTAAMQHRNREEAKNKIQLSIRFTMLLTIPCALGMAALGGPIIQLLFKNTEAGLPLAAGIMQAGALMIILYGLSTLTTGILQGLGKLQQPLIHSSIALVLHFILLYVLLTSANLNIYAVIYSNIFFAFVVCLLNAISIKRYLNYRQEFYRTFVVPTIVSMIMAAACVLSYKGINAIAGNSIATVFAILVGVIVYCIGLVSFRGITIEELASLPKGHVIIKFVRKLGLMK
ncbi:MAG: polysaccharide biosynthesis protein [Lachnospiraceae bacterium]|nr:polysaccharide biosynthesis protein [Lachnospiraceae bacterium]